MQLFHTFFEKKDSSFENMKKINTVCVYKKYMYLQEIFGFK